MSPRINPSASTNDLPLRIPSAITPTHKTDKTSTAQPSVKTTQVQPRDPIADRPITTSDSVTDTSNTGIPPQLIQDVQQIASKAGFVGLTPTAIQRAYYQGDSLFVDVSA